MEIHKINQDELKIRKAVNEHYAEAAVKIGGCCSGGGNAKVNSCGCGTTTKAGDPSTKNLYKADDFNGLPEEVTNLSLGCGDPVTLASLKEGQTVLDLGSGGGIDCFLAGKKVGPSGHVIGVDMTIEMLERARANTEKVGADNVEFRLGEIEHLPVPDHSVDVVISNCVINLSTDKPQVMREIHRVLKPGGRMAVSDIVTRGELPQEVQDSLNAWAGCMAGAMDADEMVTLLEKTGFDKIRLNPVYFDQQMVADAVQTVDEKMEIDASEIVKKIFSANISAEKPIR